MSAKGTITNGEISTTIEMQKTELKSLTYSKDNADLIITEDTIAVGAKSEREGLGAKVSGEAEMSVDEFALSASMEVGQSITSVETNIGVDGSISISYSVETKVNESASISSELELKKEKTNDNLPGWERVGIPILESLPEPVREILESPVMLPLIPEGAPIPVFSF